MYASLLPKLDQLPKQRILCVGDVMLDRFVYGHVDRISPEAPIPVLRTSHETITLGGNGNVVRNIVSLGGNVDIVSVIGQDQAGYDLTEQISNLPQITSYLLTDNSRPTTVKTRYVAGSQQLLRADSEVNTPLSPEVEQQILQRATIALESSSVVILSDYAKGVLTTKVVQEIIAKAREAGKRILVDPKGRDFTRYKGATYLTPNRKELSEATGMTIDTVEAAERAARLLIEKHDLQGVLAKLGGDGVCLVEKNQPALHFKTLAREVFDVSGAGDTVVATMALTLAAGFSSADSAMLANLAGSIVVGKIGTAAVSRDEIARELLQTQTQKSESKILTHEQAKELADLYRKQGLKVGFTNGCFDLLHPGHVQSIRKSREACDRLFIGLNSDASVKRLKGESRPVQNENARAIVLASLTDVNAVIVFDDDTPIELIKTVRPDYLMKGADYTIDQVVGGQEVQSWGGKVVLIDLVEGHSTTNTIKRLQNT